jgi:glutamate-5-semialdehyde dehydrogenase
MATLTREERDTALRTFADLVEGGRARLLEENRADREAQEGRLSPALFQRLGLDEGKLRDLVQGIRDLAEMEDPVGRVLARTRLDEDLVLTRRTVPLGVLGIIFESRPDVIPQILALVLKSGNAVVLKGGSEAIRSNTAFMHLVDRLGEACPFLPAGWAQLVVTRGAVHDILDYPEYVDLVIPRGSNELVRTIMDSTRIPVLGHADGVCHAYVHPSAATDPAVEVVIDAKVQYPSACNALEAVLVDREAAPTFLPALVRGLADHPDPVRLRACSESLPLLEGHTPLEPAGEEDWGTEYGDLTLAVRVVDDQAAAVDHIHGWGSAHTDVILAEDRDAVDRFLGQVDSANVFANCSTRFADGFRYGLGAEIGISTARTHARGPVGLDGLVIYKYVLEGRGHRVADYTGSDPARSFLHEPL